MKIGICAEKPTICFIDANMPNLNGVETVRQLKEKWPEILVISFTDDKLKGLEMIQNGADAYLPKSSPEESIIKRIQELLMN